MFNKINEECGVFGIYNKETCDVATQAYIALYALQHRDQWPEEAWLEAVRDFRDYEYSCFKNALYRMHEIDGQEAVDYIRENEFIFFQSTFPLN